MGGIILFDNSALSRFLEEPAPIRDALIERFRYLGEPRITALNVYETARTPDMALRSAKLSLYKRIAGTVSPLTTPHELLALLARARLQGDTTIDASDEIAHGLMAVPHLADGDVAQELTEWARTEERQYVEMHDQMRDQFERVFTAIPEGRFLNEHHFLDVLIYECGATVVHQLIGSFYQAATGAYLQPSEVDDFLDAVPAWRVFLAAHLHALWLRSLQTIPAGRKRTGIIDTDTAAYLLFCDLFITNDRAQQATLQAANRFNPRPTVIALFADLRTEFLS